MAQVKNYSSLSSTTMLVIFLFLVLICFTMNVSGCQGTLQGCTADDQCCNGLRCTVLPLNGATCLRPRN
ncbi:unnamed protein product [Cunninghamella echinulata]